MILGTVINRNPFLLMERLVDLETRLNYLKSKRFSKKSLATIVSAAPELLSVPTQDLDKNLGFIQKEFRLAGLTL
jgi:mTERF domain-containing protein